MGRGLRVFGGLLSGIGTGVSAQAAAVRERALKQMEEDAANVRQQQLLAAEATQGDLTRAAAATNTDKTIGSAERIDANNQAGALARTKLEVGGRSKDVAAEVAGRRGLLKTTFVDDDTGNLNTITEGGVVTDTKKKAQSKELSGEEKMALDSAIKVNTVESTVTDENGQTKIIKNINQDGVAAVLQKHKNPKIRALGKMFADGQVGSLDVNPDAPPSATVTPDDNGGYSGRGLQLPAAASGSDDVDLKSKADQIRADYKAGKISKDEANRQLNALYPQQ